MPPRKQLWLYFIIITILSFADYQIFTEGYAQEMSAMARQAGHIAILLAIAASGYFAWNINKTTRWPLHIWTWFYGFSIGIIVLAGVINIYTEIPVEILDKISTLRLFACSPVPYFILYIFLKTIAVPDSKNS